MVWLVFSVLKKVIGLVFLAAVVAAGFLLWQNPALREAVLTWVQGLVGG